MSIFDPKIRIKTPRRNRFPLSYYSRITSRIGDLVPVLCKKVVPSDRFKISISSITRLAPMANPVYDRVRIDFDAFFVQNRIIDPDWKKFITGGEGLYGEVSTEGMRDIYMHLNSFLPSNSLDLLGAGSLLDYLGLQFKDYGTDGNPNIINSFEFNALPVLAYLKIHSDWYRNERFERDYYTELFDSSAWNKNARSFFRASTDIDVVLPYLSLKSRNYGKDPFTTALAEPLVGGPVTIPMVGETVARLESPGGSQIYPVQVNVQGDSVNVNTNAGTGSYNIVTDLSKAVGATIQQLNQAYRLFSFFMKDTYNGNRYVEFIESHFNVRVPDSTLERPIFLGRITNWINFSEIFQTSGATNESNVLGDYAGMGLAQGTGFLFDETFDEHGYIMIIMSIRPNSTYFQGAAPEFFTGDRFSYYFPEFQNIGDDIVDSRLLWFDNSDGFGLQKNSGEHIFGYNRRWFDYLWYKDEIHGYFLLENQSYNWTFARKFENKPVLGADFVNVPHINLPFTYRADNAQNFYTDIYFHISALRPFERYESF